MKSLCKQFLSDYGMVFVLLLLCIFFSVMTNSDQSPVGEPGAEQVSTEIGRQFGSKAHVVIAATDQKDDVLFVDKLQRDLATSGVKVAGVVKGEPKDARELLQKISANGENLDAIACTQASGAGQVFEHLKSYFPSLGDPKVVTPKVYRWPKFLQAQNLLNIPGQIAIVAIIAIGMTLVIITGGIDLSVGSLIALSSVLATLFIRDYAGGVHASTGAMLLASGTAIILCGVVGGFSGLMVTRFRIPPFIVTLAMMLVTSGLAYTLADNQSISQVPESFAWLGTGTGLFGLSNSVVLMVILYALAHVLMSRMRLGRYIYSVGGNSEAARLSGVPVRRILMFAYVASAMLAGLGGVIMASQLKSGNGNYGGGYELFVIAAVVIGGTSLSGGEGKVLGTLIGAFTLAVIQNGMNLTKVEPNMQKVVLGLVILAAVLLDKLRHSK